MLLAAAVQSCGHLDSVVGGPVRLGVLNGQRFLRLDVHRVAFMELLDKLP